MRAVVNRSPYTASTGGVTVNPTDAPGTSQRYGVSVTGPSERPTRRSGPNSGCPPQGTLVSDGTARIVVSELTTENRAGAFVYPPPKEPKAAANCPRPTVVTRLATPNTWSVTLGATPIVSAAR